MSTAHRRYGEPAARRGDFNLEIDGRETEPPERWRTAHGDLGMLLWSERDAATHMALGLRIDETAKAMNMSYRAVQRLLRSASRKVCDPGRGSPAGLVHRCLDYGLIRQPQPIRTIDLTLKQWEVLHCAAWGMSMRRLADESGVTREAIQGRAHTLRKRIGASTMPHAVYLGRACGLLGGAVSTSQR
ncbi:helix-turn-helix transcriptional regulator [Streptomyces scopuliridis]|uniref:helix-turn-helix transcriptional regulator n=1 Tax=Streptomyces scopuliridis TaxID=452529 RepID=UPI0036874ADD